MSAPRSLAEAVELLARPGRDAVAIAGCTDLLAADHAAGRLRAEVVDVSRLPELSGIALDGGWLDIGAAETFARIAADPRVHAHAPILARAAATVGGWQIQNRATIGGNIANASPAGDSLPVLLALGAELVLCGPGGERRLPYDEVHTGYRRTALKPAELIVRVRIPPRPPGSFQGFRKVGTRAAQAISKVVVAFAAERRDGRLLAPRLAAGSVAPVPLRLESAERACRGQPVSPELAEEVARRARADVQPIDDVRSTARYRRFALGRVVRRLVLESAP